MKSRQSQPGNNRISSEYLKPIKEADAYDQKSNSRLKHKPRFDRLNNDRRQGRGNNHFKKNDHNHDWKDYPDNKYGNKHHESNRQEKKRDSSQEREISFEDCHESNMIEGNKSVKQFEGLPNLKTPYDSDSESEDEIEDKESLDETHLLQRKILKKANKTTKNETVKATVQFSLEDE